MKSLLVAVILGLLGAVLSTPVYTATFTGAENDVLQEAMIDELLIPSVTTQAPKSNPSIQASQHPSSDFENSNVIESSSDHDAGDEEMGSGNFEVKSGRGIILSHEPSTLSRTTPSPVNEDTAALSSSTVKPANAGYEEMGSGNFEVKSGRGMILGHEPATLSRTTLEETGSGNFDDKLESTTAAKKATYTISESSSTQSSHGKSGRGIILNDQEELSATKTETGLHQSNKPNEEPRNTGSRTPAWLVVLTCLVGVAVLLIVCVAVATRERWRGQSQALHPEIKTGQEREQEIEMFLHNDSPKENDSVNEYTVVPLDELPPSYTTH